MLPITAYFPRIVPGGGGNAKATVEGVEVGAGAAGGPVGAGAADGPVEADEGGQVNTECAVYRYADFATLTKPTGTTVPYEELKTPLRHLENRHAVLEELVKLAYEQHINGVAAADILPAPDTAKCVNGRARGRKQRLYDYGVRRAQQVVRKEIKSGQLKWDKTNRHWCLQFCGVKLALSDRLVLVLYAPDRILIFDFPSDREHVPGYSTQGVRTESDGGLVQWYGPRKNDMWRVTIEKIEAERGSNLVATVRYTDPRYAHLFHNTERYQTPAERAFVGTPHARLSAPVRGVVYELVARKVDELQGRPPTDAADDTLRTDGRRRGRSDKSNDYDINAPGGIRLRVEAKSAQPKWGTSSKSWKIEPCGIKADRFDVFRLAVPTPRGINVYGCTTAALRPYLCTNGKRTKSCGKSLIQAGKRGERCIDAAIQTIHTKLRGRGIELLARVLF